MKTPSQEDLLGYVLGALEAQEERDVQHYLDTNPDAEEELLTLREGINPLSALDPCPESRPGLARRTCELVANLESTQQIPAANSAVEDTADPQVVTPASLFRFSTIAERFHHPFSFARTDLLACIAVIAIFSSILFPAISWSRFNSRISSCQNNLRHVGLAMLQYSDLHGQPNIQIPSASSHRSATSSFVPVLLEVGLIEDESTFSCAGLGDVDLPSIPSRNQLSNAQGSQLSELQQRMGGHFGYALGFFEGKTWQAPRNVGSSQVVVLADRPSNKLPGRRSDNHGGRGQNLFFGDGHVSFVKGHAIGNDAIYENDMGIVGPGVGPHDNVIAPSHLEPVLLDYISPSTD